MVTIKSPDGGNRQVPLWMTEAEADNYQIASAAAVSVRAVLRLARLLASNEQLQEKGVKRSPNSS